MVMDEDVKRWTARRKSALVLEIIQGKTTVAEAARSYDLTPSEIEEWVDQGKAGMENALRAKPEDIREQYERQLKDLQETYGEAMLELRARKNSSPCWARKSHDRGYPAGTKSRRLRGSNHQTLPLVRCGPAQRLLQAKPGNAKGGSGLC